MKNLLIITHNQFGYQISSYYYAQYLKKRYKIDYVSFDESKEKVSENEISVHYHNKTKNLLKSYYGLIRKSIVFIKKNIPDHIIIKYFPGCSIIPIITLRKIVLDIRTASVSSSPLKNLLLNVILRFESIFYYKIIILSFSLKKRLFIPSAIVIPLGAEPKGFSIKTFDSLRMLYIGSFNNRNIHHTIKGLKYFIDGNPDINIHYTIIGAGKEYYLNLIQKEINNNDLKNRVTMLGRIPHTELAKYFAMSNIGISYIPVTKYFDKQPPSKTYEYLMAVMPVLATATYENRRIINNENGVIIDDTPESFAMGLKEVWDNRNKWDSEIIASTVSEYRWEYIISNKLKPLLE